MPAKQENGVEKHTNQQLKIMMSDNATPHIMTTRALDIDDLDNLICWMPAEITRKFNSLANARRLVACWNYCKGKATELLEAAVEYNEAPDDAGWEEPHPIFMMAQERDTLAAQRAELVGILRRIMKSTPHSMCWDAEAWAMGENALRAGGGE